MNKKVLILSIAAIFLAIVAVFVWLWSQRQLQLPQGVQNLEPSEIVSVEKDDIQPVETVGDSLQGNLDELLSDEDLANLYENIDEFGFTWVLEDN